jgi:hypothetical protein
MYAKTAWVLVTCGDEDLLSLAELSCANQLHVCTATIRHRHFTEGRNMAST